MMDPIMVRKGEVGSMRNAGFWESVATLLGIPALRLLNAALGSEKTVTTVSSTFDHASPRKEEDRNILKNMLALNSIL